MLETQIPEVIETGSESIIKLKVGIGSIPYFFPAGRTTQSDYVMEWAYQDAI